MTHTTFGSFVSYTRHDEGPRKLADAVILTADRLKNAARELGLEYRPVFLDRLYLPEVCPADELKWILLEAIWSSDFTTAFVTENFFGDSQWCPREYRWSWRRGFALRDECALTERDRRERELLMRLGVQKREPPTPISCCAPIFNVEASSDLLIHPDRRFLEELIGKFKDFLSDRQRSVEQGHTCSVIPADWSPRQRAIFAGPPPRCNCCGANDPIERGVSGLSGATYFACSLCGYVWGVRDREQGE